MLFKVVEDVLADLQGRVALILAEVRPQVQNGLDRCQLKVGSVSPPHLLAWHRDKVWGGFEEGDQIVEDLDPVLHLPLRHVLLKPGLHPVRVISDLVDDLLGVFRADLGGRIQHALDVAENGLLQPARPRLPLRAFRHLLCVVLEKLEGLCQDVAHVKLKEACALLVLIEASQLQAENLIGQMGQEAKLDPLLIVLLDVPLGVGSFKLVVSAEFRIPDWLYEVLHRFEEGETVVALCNHVVMRESGKVCLYHFDDSSLVGLHQTVEDLESFQYKFFDAFGPDDLKTLL